ncbi:BAG family molecular chaperone regulator 4 isoform X2 [Microcaecilia unicolor]|uniref:BAG family molecular chaperone regulator 4 isoform X2 n=1 Tax=Microcaecilia unicolor TaxID=1415580 RepID=A0A6P7XYZ0_9AMPH|nr:BAG family molecular chaperone regulator 4 isoform X2 [Microcaecilia unicolor]
MSALRKLGGGGGGDGGGGGGPGYGRYYGDMVGQEALLEPTWKMERSPRGQETWSPGYYYSQEMGQEWPAQPRAGGRQEQPYPAYSPGYWNSLEHPPAPYPGAYSVGPEMQGQGMEPYANGVYSSSYVTSPVGPINQQYPTSTFYSPAHPQVPYHMDPTAAYKSSGGPSASSQWPYSHQSCLMEDPSPRNQGPVYPPCCAHQAEGMRMSSYPYGDAHPRISQQAPPPPPPPPLPMRSQEDGWPQHGAYGMQQHYPWPPAQAASPRDAHSNSFPTGSTSSWSGTGMPPASYDSRDPSSYNKLDPGINQPSYYPETNPQNMGPNHDRRPTPPPRKIHYSASPQLYENVPRRHPVSQDMNSTPIHPPDTLSSHPGIQKISQILEQVHVLDGEVDEFVGKKTDKAYWCLEELLTKQLLELDSVETGGQDSVRQARKDAVRKLQAILEKLERKAL